MLTALRRWVADRVGVRTRQPGESCRTCRWYSDFGPEEDEPRGYCMNVTAWPEHAAYGGHWSGSDAWCHAWAPETGEGRSTQ